MKKLTAVIAAGIMIDSALNREHMDLVDDINAVARAVRLELHLVDNIADVVNIAVRGGVHLNNVKHAAVFGAEAVGGFGKDFCAGGLARSARAREQIGVIKPVFDYFVFKRGGNMLLTCHVLKGFRPPFAIQNLIQSAHLPFGLEKKQAALIQIRERQTYCIASGTLLNAARFPA